MGTSRSQTSGISRVSAQAGTVALYATAFLQMAGVTGRAAAQTAIPDTGNVQAIHAVRLFQPLDFVAVAGMAAAVAAVMPADRRIERAFQRPGVQTNSGLERFFGAVGVLGDPGSVVVSAAL
ncbi:MAG: hypothetical protein M3P26_07105, partial [Gemmatimonadota bacterium]|nr:hypothetical protein [Gemmatimonadota bacterium]